MPRFFHDKNSKCTRAVFAGRLSQPSGSLLSGASGAFRGFHPAAGFPAVLPQWIRKRKPPPYIPLRKSVPPQRAAPTAAIPRGTAPDTASAPSILPPEKAKAPPGTQGECQSACEQNGAGGSRQGNGAGSPGQGSRAGAGREEEPDRAGQPDNTAQAKNGLVPAGDQAVPGESSKKCLSFSKAA